MKKLQRRICAPLLISLLLGCAQLAAADEFWLAESARLKPATQTISQPETIQPGPWADRWIQRHAVDNWNEEALKLIVKYRTNPLRAVRALSLLHIAMHDGYFRAKQLNLGQPARQAAMHTAASAMLDHLFPLESPGRVEALGTVARAAVTASASQTETDQLPQGEALGKMLAHALILHVLNDKVDEVWDARTRPTPGPNVWEPVPPMETAHPQEPLAGTWRTWVLNDGSELKPTTPLNADELKTAALEVLQVSQQLTDEQKRIAEYWHLDQGTVTPSGVWNRMALDLANRRNLDEESKIRLLAALNIGMYDASVACWHAKFTYWVPRPLTLIRKYYDKNFMPYLVTPPHPSYVSGHATTSGAAAEVLQHFLTNDGTEINRWAEEAAMSRLYGGIHYRYDDDAGLTLGHKVGRKVVDKLDLHAVQNQAAAVTIME